jgi:mono/diheme cytochrome c family protein
MKILAPILFAAISLATAARAAEPETVTQGRYQSVLADCEGCHTAPGGKSYAGGAVLQTPFGRIAVPNITPDRDTGIGNWTESQFRRAMRQGIAPDGKRLYPAMPYPAYTHMRDSDLAALWTYLKTVTPVRHTVQATPLPFPFNIRALMRAWNWLYLKQGPLPPVAGKSEAWNRGAYLVAGPGHCGTCHTAKSLLGADRATALTGQSLQGWFAPEITGAAPRGVGGWSDKEIVAYLKTGWNGRGTATGPMKEVVENSTSRMTNDDLTAIAVYLKDLPAGRNAPAGARPTSDDPIMMAGAALYRDNCQSCHDPDGKGQHLIFPPLAGNPTLIQSSAENLARVVLEGAQAASTGETPTAPGMPSFAFKLDDHQMAALLTYIRNSWGNQAPAVTADRIARLRRQFTQAP